MYRLHMRIGNFSVVVFESDDFYEIQENLYDRWLDTLSDLGEISEEEQEKEHENFMSYFNIEEV